MSEESNNPIFPFPIAIFPSVSPPLSEASGQPFVGSLAYYQKEVERLAAQLTTCQAEREREKLRLSDALIQAGQTAFELEQRAQGNAEKIIAGAKSQAEQIIAAANRETDRIRSKLNTELAAMKEVLKGLAEGSQATQKTAQEQFRAFNKSLLQMSDILSDTQMLPDKSHQTENPDSEDTGFLDRMSKILKDVPGPEYVSDSHDPHDPHKIVGN
jgi:hypothetical protein